MRPRRTFKEKLPFGLGVKDKPRHYREMLGAAWENRDNLRFAWRILKHGVCDGCSLGPRGLQDDVVPGTHLCLSRLRLMRLNTMPAISGSKAMSLLGDIGTARRLTQQQLHSLGRVPYPMVYRKGDEGFARIDWDEAAEICAEYGRDELGRVLPPESWGFFCTSRGISNEAYYVFQKAARLLGTNNVDLAARMCHAATEHGLSETLGVGAPTCSLADMVGTDLLLLWGTDVAKNQPMVAKYLMHAKRRGTTIVVVNPAREKGLETYWIPSDWKSAVFGTDLCDEYFRVRVGGDIAFLYGVLKGVLAREAQDEEFIHAHTEGFEFLRSRLDKLSWEELERESGAARADMDRVARLFCRSRSCVAVYSMGLTQHRFGVDCVKALVNLMLSRGMLGRAKCGIMPICGHSGVQGGGECGVDPARYPGGFRVGPDTGRFEEIWGRPLNPKPGLRTGKLMEACHEGRIRFLYSLGGNLLQNMPDPDYMREAFRRVPFRIHQDVVFNTSTVAEPGECVLVLPAQTRYEHEGGVTSTNTERRIRFSPEIPGPRVPEAAPEWWIPAFVAMAVDPGLESALDYPGGTVEIREEIERAMPMYAGISELRQEGDWLQWGGARLCQEGDFGKMPDNRARFSVVSMPNWDVPEGKYLVTTRRGRQFNSMVFPERGRRRNGTTRSEVYLAHEELAALGLREGARVRLRSETGAMEAVVRGGDLPPRTLQAFWPEANVLIPRRYDPVSEEPDYNALVEIERVQP